MLVQKIKYDYDVNALNSIVMPYLSTDLAVRMDGISIQHRTGVDIPWNLIDGLESLSIYGNAVKTSDFQHVNTLFKYTILEDIIKKFNLYRTRIMILEAGKCYSLHADKNYRFHIPIVTNDKCFFYFPETQENFVLEQSCVYIVNTTRMHTFINASKQQRVHLVGDILDANINVDQPNQY